MTARRYACELCGHLLYRDRYGLVPSCPAHPCGERMEWTQEHIYARNYLRRAAASGQDVDRLVETFDPVYWPGVSQGVFALTLVLLRRWGDLPAVEAAATPEKLYG